MAIIYSYPSETNIQASDLLVGTSTVEVNGKKSNVTRSYSIQNLTDYIKTLGGLGVESITFSAPLTGGTITTTGTVGITKADGTTDGYLSSADWTNFNSKLGGISGTQDKIPIWTSSSDLGNSSLTETSGGTTITSAKHFVPSAASTYDLGLTGTRWNVGYINTVNSTTVNATTVSSTDVTITGVINAAGLGPGSTGEVLVSKGASPAQWESTSSFGDLYDINVTTQGSDVDLNLTASTAASSKVQITAGSGIVLTRNAAQQMTIERTADTYQGTVNEIDVDPTGTAFLTVTNGTPSTPAGKVTLNPQVGTVGVGQTGLVSGDAVNTAIQAALTGLVEFKGGFDGNTGKVDGTSDYLDNRGTEIAGAVGDYYVVTVAGTFYAETVETGDSLICQTAYTSGNGSLAKWITVQNNIGVATDTVKGIASFPSADVTNKLVITAGEVVAQKFSGAGTQGYVPDSTGSTTKFLRGDGNWADGPAAGVSDITFNTGLTGGLITGPGSTITVDYSSGTNVIASATNGIGDTLDDDDLFLFQVKSPSTTVKYAKLQDIETYIGSTYPGTVTSVGLATDNGAGAPMAAFTITNSPVTTSGTLTLGITGGGVGKFLKDDGTWDTVPTAYAWTITGDTGSYAVDTGATVDIEGGTAITTAATGSTAAPKITINSTVFSGGSNVGHVPDASAASSGDFLDYQGNWSAPAGGGGAQTKELFTSGGTTYTLTGGQTPTTADAVLVYVSGVYQSVGDFTFAAGPPPVITLTSTVPSGTKVEIVAFS